MDTTKAWQIALDDTLVAPVNYLKIGKCNQRLSSTLKSNEPTLQVVLDALKLTPFYKAFEITANVPEIYIQEFWATVSIHHKSLRFKINNKSHILNLENFRDMLQICPRLPGQKFIYPPLEEEILSFIRDLSHTGEIKDSKAYKQYYAVASGVKPPKAKTKYKKKADKPVTHSKSKTAPASKGSGLKSPAKVTKSGKKKIPAQGLETLSETTLSEAEQMKVVTKRSKADYHISHASGSGANEGIGVTPGVPYGSEDEQISWKSSDDEDDDEVSESKDDDDDDDDADNEDDDDADNEDDADQADDNE
ncbi:hypothetical protein Tco_1393993 [Tanacetum coccineum]